MFYENRGLEGIRTLKIPQKYPKNVPYYKIISNYKPIRCNQKMRLNRNYEKKSKLVVQKRATNPLKTNRDNSPHLILQLNYIKLIINVLNNIFNI